MRKIISYISQFWKQEVKVWYFISIVLFIACCIFAEYYFRLTSQWMSPYKKTIYYFYCNIVFYALPVFTSILLYIKFHKRSDLLKNASFWFVVSYIILSYAFRSYFYQHRDWATQLNGGFYDSYLIKCSNQIMQAVIVFVAVLVFWLFSGHKYKTPLYGFRLKGFDTKPYFVMLLIMIPIIAVASTQSDFLGRYPTFQGFTANQHFSGILALKMGLYEMLYGSDFVMTELFFRGFMIYVLARFMGRGCILPMACMYVFIHFGKPAGETISSFFGGTLLGIIAFETNSIIGGIIVHCGIAYMMEFGGFWGNIFFN